MYPVCNLAREASTWLNIAWRARPRFVEVHVSMTRAKVTLVRVWYIGDRG